MKELQSIQASGKLPAGTTIKGRVREILPPNSDEPDKMRVILEWPPDPEVPDLKVVLVGKHLHFGNERLNHSLVIQSEKDGALYLSVFDDGRALTVRDGVRFSFHAPKPGTVATVDDEVRAHAEHYAVCYRAAQAAVGSPESAVQAAASSIYIQTKGKVVVAPAAQRPAAGTQRPETPQPSASAQPPETPPETPSAPSTPSTPDPKPDDAQPKPEPPKQMGELQPVPPPDPKLINRLSEIGYPEFIERATKAFLYGGANPQFLSAQEAFQKAAEARRVSTNPDVWSDILNEIHQVVDAAGCALLERLTEEAKEKDPALSDADVDRIVSRLYVHKRKQLDAKLATSSA